MFGDSLFKDMTRSRTELTIRLFGHDGTLARPWWTTKSTVTGYRSLPFAKDADGVAGEGFWGRFRQGLADNARDTAFGPKAEPFTTSSVAVARTAEGRFGLGVAEVTQTTRTLSTAGRVLGRGMFVAGVALTGYSEYENQLNEMRPNTPR